jgi:hypothetical protein
MSTDSPIRTQSAAFAAALRILGHRARITLQTRPGDKLQPVYEFGHSARADYIHLMARMDEIRQETERLIEDRQKGRRQEAMANFITVGELLEEQP